MKKCQFMMVSCWFLLRMRNVSHKRCGENEKQKTHFMFNKCFLKIVLFMIYVGKYGTARQATDENKMRHGKDVIWKPDNNGKNGHILVTFRTHCFPVKKIFR